MTHGPGGPGSFAAPRYAVPGYLSAYPIRYWQPAYPITVIDTVAPNVRPDRIEQWRAIRDQGLGQWEPTGLMIETFEVPNAAFPEYPINVAEGAEYPDLQTAIIPHKVRLGRDPKGTIKADYASYNNVKDGGVAFVSINRKTWEGHNFKSEVAAVTHEVGHCLGLAHRGDGGIMSGGWTADAHDIEAVRAWFFDGISQ